jgi:hypothetical protein
VTAGIGINGENADVRYQAPDRNKSDQPVFSFQGTEKFCPGITRKAEIIDQNKNDKRGYNAKGNAQPEVIFLKKQNSRIFPVDL